MTRCHGFAEWRLTALRRIHRSDVTSLNRIALACDIPHHGWIGQGKLVRDHLGLGNDVVHVVPQVRVHLAVDVLAQDRLGKKIGFRTRPTEETIAWVRGISCSVEEGSVRAVVAGSKCFPLSWRSMVLPAMFAVMSTWPHQRLHPVRWVNAHSHGDLGAFGRLRYRPPGVRAEPKAVDARLGKAPGDVRMSVGLQLRGVLAGGDTISAVEKNSGVPKVVTTYADTSPGPLQKPCSAQRRESLLGHPDPQAQPDGVEGDVFLRVGPALHHGLRLDRRLQRRVPTMFRGGCPSALGFEEITVGEGDVGVRCVADGTQGGLKGVRVFACRMSVVTLTSGPATLRTTSARIGVVATTFKAAGWASRLDVVPLGLHWYRR